MHDTIVNQLLTKIDGVNALNNILVIGMTNRWARVKERIGVCLVVCDWPWINQRRVSIQWSLNDCA